MSHAILAIGTNTDHEANMALALSQIGTIATITAHTAAVWTEPVGNAHGKFLNCLLRIDTALSLNELMAETKRIECLCGRSAEQSAVGIIAMDLDLMEYNNQRMHQDDWQRDYIKQLMKQL